MRNSFYLATDLPHSFDDAWLGLDFPAPGWVVSEGGPREIGAVRTLEIPEVGRIVDRLTGYRDGANRRHLSYALINEDNPFAAVGYEGSITLLRHSTDAGRSILVYESRWDEFGAPDPAEAIRGLFSGMIENLGAQIAAAKA